MAKNKSIVYVCSECGHDSGAWMGSCPKCGAWNSLKEFSIPVASQGRGTVSVVAEASEIFALNDVITDKNSRVSCAIPEFDRVCGGGLVAGSAILLGGDPGIGKSTLLMQTASHLAKTHTVLYVTGEESAAQLKSRAERLSSSGDILVYPEVDVDAIIAQAQKLNPFLLIIDSIQTMCATQSQSAPGSVSQVREVTSRLIRYAKAAGAILIIVGHVTKDGALAGPRTLEHMVDTVLYFEGDRHDSCRILRTVKNRFGATNEIGVFEMGDAGLSEVSDPASLFLSNTGAPGCAITVCMEGTRPMLLEIQALLSPNPFGNTRRMATGFDTNRLVLLMAVLEKRMGIRLSDKDVYLNVVGGMRIEERAADLAVALAVASAYYDIALPVNCAAVGEIGLTGELRTARNMDKRFGECARRGFSLVIAPQSASASVVDGVEVRLARTVSQALSIINRA